MSKGLKQAFTLIELLVVIVIIGILSGLIIVVTNGMTGNANMAKAKVFSNSLRSVLMMNIVAQYTFDDIIDYDPSTKVINSTAENVPDSWSDNEGTASGEPFLREGNDCVFVKCIQFDGSNYINVGTLGTWGSERNNSFTISAWVKPNINNAMMSVMAVVDNATNGRNGVTLKVNTSSTLNLLAGSVRIGLASNETSPKALNGATNANYVPVGVWTYIATTVIPPTNTVKIYINGASKSVIYGTRTTPAIFSNFANFFTLGAHNTPSGVIEKFNGSIDDVRIYNAVMPTSYIKEQYYAGLNNLLINGSIDKEEYIKLLASR
jgi:prepilin-type N-terminal cleavage/methylation domain-containing protein